MENFRKEHQGETCDSFQRRRLREDGKKRPWKLTWLAGKSTMNESMYFLMEMGKISTLMWVSGVYMGVSLNGGTPQNTPKWSFLVGKPMVVGYHHFRKPPYTPFFTFFFSEQFKKSLLMGRRCRDSWDEAIFIFLSGRPTHQLWGRAVDGCFKYSTMGLQFLNI